jgi:hypothetical protein
MVSATAASSGGADFSAKPLQFFRLTHDAVRSGLNDCAVELEALPSDLDNANEAITKLAELLAVTDLITALTAKSLIPRLSMLYKKPEVDHVELAALQAQTDAARANVDKYIAVVREDEKTPSKSWANKLFKSFGAWRAPIELTMVKVEELCSEHGPKVSPDVYGRARAVNVMFDVVGLDAILAVHLPFVLHQLAHVKRSYNHLRMMCSTLQTVMTPEEWDRAKQVMPGAVGEVNWKQLLKDGMKKPGRLIDPSASGAGGSMLDMGRKSLKKSKSLVLKARKSFVITGGALFGTEEDKDTALVADEGRPRRKSVSQRLRRKSTKSKSKSRSKSKSKPEEEEVATAGAGV